MVLYSCYCLGHFRISGALVGFHSEMKRAMCIVELYNHTGIFKNTRDVHEQHEPKASATRTSRVFLKIPKCLYNLTMLEERVFLFLL